MMQVSHVFHHCRSANFSSISFFEPSSTSSSPPSTTLPPLLVAGDVDGFVHVFNLRSMRQISLLNVAQQEAAVIVLDKMSASSALGSGMAALFDKLETPKSPHGVLAAGIVRVAVAGDEQARPRFVMWAQSRTMVVSVFDGSAPMGLEEEDDESESSNDDDDDDDDEDIATVKKLSPLMILDGIRNYSFAPAVCIPHRSLLFFFCPHETDVIVNYETGERGTAPALKVFGANLHLGSKRAELAVDMCYDDENAFGTALGQIMNLTTTMLGAQQEQQEQQQHLLAVGSEAGFVILLCVDLDALVSPFAAAQRGAVPFSVLVKTRVAVDPVMSLMLTMMTKPPRVPSSSSAVALLVCGTAEGTLCTVRVEAAAAASETKKQQKSSSSSSNNIWSVQLAAGVGHIAAAAAAENDGVVAFLWNGDVMSMMVAGEKKEEDGGDDAVQLVPLQSAGATSSMGHIFPDATPGSKASSSSSSAPLAVEFHSGGANNKPSSEIARSLSRLLSSSQKERREKMMVRTMTAFAISDKKGALAMGVF